MEELGEHRLKDLSDPQELFQLRGAGLRESFPPLARLTGYFTNLPSQASALLGREAELGRVGALLGAHRLVTLTGTGGTGKTRLALQAGADALDRYPGGVFFCDLAALSDAMLVVPAIARAVGLQERSGETIAETVAGYLGSRRVLLILDNFEQVLAASPAIATLIASGPEARVLVTSRAPLRIAGEQEFQVEGLALHDAVALFDERASLVGVDVTGERDTIEAICERLDRLPLAIELAVARLRSLSLDDQFVGRTESTRPMS